MRFVLLHCRGHAQFLLELLDGHDRFVQVFVTVLREKRLSLWPIDYRTKSPLHRRLSMSSQLPPPAHIQLLRLTEVTREGTLVVLRHTVSISAVVAAVGEGAAPPLLRDGRVGGDRDTRHELERILYRSLRRVLLARWQGTDILVN